MDIKDLKLRAEQSGPKAQIRFGEAEGQFNLGWMYANDLGLAEDKVQSAHWDHKSAEQNHAIAQYNLGAHHLGRV